MAQLQGDRWSGGFRGQCQGEASPIYTSLPGSVEPVAAGDPALCLCPKAEGGSDQVASAKGIGGVGMYAGAGGAGASGGGCCGR